MVPKMAKLMEKGGPDRAPQNHHGTVLEHTSELEAHMARNSWNVPNWPHLAEIEPDP